MHGPIISGWELYFNEAHGYDNRSTVARAFTNFWQRNYAEKLEIPGKCMLGGKVYGHEKFNDGEEIMTSNVESVERVERSKQNGVSHDLMCATTKSGSKYYFYSDNYNVYMFQILGDLIHKGKLSRKPHHYVKRRFHELGLI